MRKKEQTMMNDTTHEKSQTILTHDDDLQKRRENSLLSVQNLKVWFELRRLGFGVTGYVHAVDGVNFDLDYRETIAIVGESGCGKTTLMKSILALYQPTEGDIYFEGKPLSELNVSQMRSYRSEVGYVQQDPYGALAPFMNIRTILEEPMIINGIKNKKERRDRILNALEEVKLTPPSDFLDKFPHMLSGGQQQRVVLARAMSLEPKMIVADEPVSMLDASVRVEILRLMESLQERHNLAVIYITHDLSTVRYFSERVFVMYAGQLIEKTLIDDVVHDPKHPYTQALMEATSDPDADNAMHYRDVPPGEPPSLVNPPNGCRFHPRCPHKIDGLCEVKVPPYFVTKPNQYVACWLYKAA
jgi:peptide/nickel transport system ATP-binding protein